MNAARSPHPPAGDAPAVDAMLAVNRLIQPGLDRLDITLREIAQPADPILGPLLTTILPGSGKRLRPSLSLLIGQLGTTSGEALNHMAVGVELLHSASLVHDDVVDVSETRRGNATLFTRVGNALAVLVGDYLFSQAAQACVSTGNLKVVQLFAETLRAMTQGQIDEANAHRGSHAWQSMSRDQYFRTIRGKTASLFVLATEGTGILAGLPVAAVHALRTYGENLGLAFQVVDDILDFSGTEAELGKPVGGDLRQGTITLPVLLLRDSGPAGEALRQAFEAGDLDRQLLLVQESESIAASFGEADRLIQGAREALGVLPPGDVRHALDRLAVFVTERRR